MLDMKPSKSTWYLLLLVVVIVVAIILNEGGLGLISVLLLYPAYLLFEKIWGNAEPGE
jgi:hypothetical protein